MLPHWAFTKAEQARVQSLTSDATTLNPRITPLIQSR